MQAQQLGVMQQFTASAFNTVVRSHKLGEIDNECTSHISIILAICVSKIIEFGGNLTEFWQKQVGTFFGTLCIIIYFSYLCLFCMLLVTGIIVVVNHFSSPLIVLPFITVVLCVCVCIQFAWSAFRCFMKTVPLSSGYVVGGVICILLLVVRCAVCVWRCDDIRQQREWMWSISLTTQYCLCQFVRVFKCSGFMS